MTNPFIGLETQEKGYPIQFTEPPQTWLASHPWTDVAQQFDNLVCEVLQSLVDIAYLDHSGRSHLTKNKRRYYPELDEEPVWSIGYFIEQMFSETGRYRPEIVWLDRVVVTLIFAETNKPVLFECTRSGGYFMPVSKEGKPGKFVLCPKIRCGLTEAELIEAMKQLF